MKISNRATAVLDFLKTGKFVWAGRSDEHFALSQQIEAFRSFYNNDARWENPETAGEIAKLFLVPRKLQIVTSPFEQALNTSIFSYNHDRHKRLLGVVRGSLIFPDGLSIMYMITENQLSISLAAFKNKSLVFHAFTHKHIEATSIWFDQDNVSAFSPSWTVPPPLMSKKEMFEFFKLRVLSTLFFIKYAPIETVQLKGGKKIHAFDCKYVNESLNDIEILNSAWMTTYEKKEGFGVKSHYRLQACGPLFCQHKMVFIKSYQKTGYTAPARKLSAKF